MANLTAWYCLPGGERLQLWTVPLTSERAFTVGRAANAPDEYRTDFGVDDPRVPAEHQNTVSYKHATLTWDGLALSVQSRTHPKPPTNAIEWLDRKQRVADGSRVEPGRGFRIPPYFEFALVHSATFAVAATPLAVPMPRAAAESRPDFALDFSQADAAGPLGCVSPAALVNELQWIIGQADLDHSEEVLASLFLSRVLRLAPLSRVAVIACPAVPAEPVPLFAQPPDDPTWHFSRKLVREVAERRAGKMIGWAAGDAAGYSVDASTAWAVCAPIPAVAAEAVRLVLYATGRSPETIVGDREFASDPELQVVCKLIELMAGVYAVLARLGRQQAELRQIKRFLPKAIRDGRGPVERALDPRVVPLTVLFCDLRRSVGLAAAGSEDLDEFWRTVLRPALGFMAEAVVNHDGVIGSFLGDAVMAFWGWPEADPRQAENAVRSALEIRWKFMKEKDRSNSALASLGFGIGIASGPAVVGRLGTPEQHKVDAVGPTVNLASRVEGLTKAFGATILVDGPTLSRASLGRAGRWRSRRIGWVLPVGVETPVELFDLLPVSDEFNLAPNEIVCDRYERALDLFERGEWRIARRELEPILAADRPARCLASVIGDRASPPDEPAPWPRTAGADPRCAIRFDSK